MSHPLWVAAVSHHKVFPPLTTETGVMGWILSAQPWVKARSGERASPAPPLVENRRLSSDWKKVHEDPHVASSVRISTITADINDEWEPSQRKREKPFTINWLTLELGWNSLWLYRPMTFSLTLSEEGPLLSFFAVLEIFCRCKTLWETVEEHEHDLTEILLLLDKSADWLLKDTFLINP